MCFFGIYVLKFVVERCFWEIKMLIGSLVELHAWLHSYLCFSLLESWFSATSTDPRHLLDTWLICRALKLFLITILTPSRQLGGSIEKVSVSSIASRQLMDRSSFFNHVWWILPRHLSTAASVNALTLDTFLDTCLDTSIYQALLTSYIKVQRDFLLTFLDLSLDRTVLSPP